MNGLHPVFENILSAILPKEIFINNNLKEKTMDIEFTTTEKTLLEIVSAFKPKIFPDGDKWCCLYGKNLQEGIAAFGVNPMNAVYNFYLELFKETT